MVGDLTNFRNFLSSNGSSTTKTGRHDIAEILLKVALNTINQNQIQIIFPKICCAWFLIF
jgi:hypothetical protein